MGGFILTWTNYLPELTFLSLTCKRSLNDTKSVLGDLQSHLNTWSSISQCIKGSCLTRALALSPGCFKNRTPHALDPTSRDSHLIGLGWEQEISTLKKYRWFYCEARDKNHRLPCCATAEVYHADLLNSHPNSLQPDKLNLNISKELARLKWTACCWNHTSVAPTSELRQTNLNWTRVLARKLTNKWTSYKYKEWGYPQGY